MSNNTTTQKKRKHPVAGESAKGTHPWRVYNPGAFSSRYLPQGDRPLKRITQMNRAK